MHNLLKVGLAVPRLHLAEPDKNADEIIKLIEQAEAERVELLVFPELAVTGVTCGDLFRSAHLLDEAHKALDKITQATAQKQVAVLVGTPYRHYSRLYNIVALIQQGNASCAYVKNIDPKSSQARWFDNALCRFDVYHNSGLFNFGQPMLKFEQKQLYIQVVGASESLDCAHVHIDPWAVSATLHPSPTQSQKTQPATGKAWLSLTPGSYESTTDHVYTGHVQAYENGHQLVECNADFDSLLRVTYLDRDNLQAKSYESPDEHATLNINQQDGANHATQALVVLEPGPAFTFYEEENEHGDIIDTIVDPVTLSEEELLAELRTLRPMSPTPYLPADPDGYNQIIHLQATALARRLMAAHAKSAVIGISGGLDSTMALVALCEAFDLLGWDKQGIIAVTLPGFGTSEQTYANAHALANALGVSLREIDIVPSVKQHLADIAHDGTTPDITYENAQARERTQILMDLANLHSGIVIGTGDLSEAMLGFSTYNGDQMSMYNPNAGLLKTVIQHTLTHVANTRPHLAECLSAIVDTPISPELLPSVDKSIAQKTEDILGSYLVNDFIIYHHLRGVTPAKLLFLARAVFEPQGMSKAQLKEALKNFYRRFFASQFKRSASPDGPDIMGMSTSPRGGLVMPSDVSATSWLQTVETL